MYALERDPHKSAADHLRRAAGRGVRDHRPGARHRRPGGPLARSAAGRAALVFPAMEEEREPRPPSRPTPTTSASRVPPALASRRRSPRTSQRTVVHGAHLRSSFSWWASRSSGSSPSGWPATRGDSTASAITTSRRSTSSSYLTGAAAYLGHRGELRAAVPAWRGLQLRRLPVRPGRLHVARGGHRLRARAAIGVALASVFVHSGLLERAFVPYVVASQTIPIVALAPLIVAGLGRGLRASSSSPRI